MAQGWVGRLMDATSALIDQFLRADPPEMRRMLEGRQGRLLLHPAVEATLRGTAKQAAGAGEVAAAQFFSQHADLLVHCREHGVAAVFAAIYGPQEGKTSSLPDDPDAALAELQRLQRSDAKDPASLDRQIALCRMLLPMIDRRGPSQDVWAEIQFSLGYALQTQNERGDPKLLAEAVAAYRQALQVLTKERTTQAWAMAHNNLGNALVTQGERGDPQLLAEAIAAFRCALEVHTRTEMARQWAMTQNNLGNALVAQGEQIADPRLFAEAVGSYRLALEVFNKEETPQNWAETQNNLGTALRRLGELDDPRSLAEAVVAYNRALEVRTGTGWAMTQNNLGNALLTRGELGELRSLGEAAAAYRLALEVYDKEDTPHLWADTQNNLGVALLRQGELGDRRNMDLLAEAVAAFQRALEVRTRTVTPRLWAMTQSNLGNALTAANKQIDDPRSLLAAVTAYRHALEVRDPERTPVDYLGTARALGRAFLRQEAWPEVVKELEPLLAAGVALVFAEPTRSRQRILLERLSGIGDDLAAAWLAQSNAAKAVEALGRGRAILLNLIAAIARAGEQLDLQQARSAWRGAQSAADKAEELERTATPAQLDEARATASKARDAVHASYLRFRELLKEAGLDAPLAVAIAELAAAVPAGGALVMPVLPSHGDGRVLVLAGGRDQPVLVPAIEGFTGDWLGERLQRWFAGYAAFRNAAQAKGYVDDDDIAAWNRAMATVLTEIGEMLMAPLDQFLRKEVKLAADADIVLILPGRLSALPLHAAPVNIEGEAFLDHWVVRQVPSPHLLLAGNAALAARRHVPPTLLAVTNPTADQALGRQSNPALPFFAEDARIELREGKAKVAQVRETAESKVPGWTHYSFFCHGRWDHADPDRSGLRMNDGMLSVAEFRDLNLSTSRFAMIAACETALHDLNRIPDEFASVPTALAEAGVPCVVASLWPVGVDPTRQLVEGVFRRLIKKNMPPAAALRAAQLELRGKDWRFAPVLGWGASAVAEAAPAAAGQEPNTGPEVDGAPSPALFSWAGFVCYGG